MAVKHLTPSVGNDHTTIPKENESLGSHLHPNLILHSPAFMFLQYKSARKLEKRLLGACFCNLISAEKASLFSNLRAVATRGLIYHNAREEGSLGGEFEKFPL